MVNEAIDFRFLLIENYKKLKLDESELATIFVMDQLIGQGNPIITADLLSLKMTLSIDQLDHILASLLKKGMIDFVSEGHRTITTLAPLKQKLYREFQVTIAQEERERTSKKATDSLQNIFFQFQESLGRALSPLEVSRIREWISYGYSDEMIINALKEALSKGKKSIKSVDKILLSWATREDVESEGHSPLGEDWTRNMEETIKIAQTPWVNGDGKKD